MDRQRVTLGPKLRIVHVELDVQIEQRQTDRRPVRLPAVLHVGSLQIEARTYSLGMEGASVMVAIPPPIASSCELSIQSWMLADGASLVVGARVVSVVLAGIAGFRIGLKFTEVSPDAHLELDKLLHR